MWHIGGFSGQNNGEIKNCFSIVKIKAKKGSKGGFAGENIGTISHSFYSGEVRGLHGGISGVGNGKKEKTYFFHDEDSDKKKKQKPSVQTNDPLSQKHSRLRNLHDRHLGIYHEDVGHEDYLRELGFDVDNIWEYLGGTQVSRFAPHKWMFDVTQSQLYPKYANDTTTSGARPASGGGAAVAVERRTTGWIRHAVEAAIWNRHSTGFSRRGIGSQTDHSVNVAQKIAETTH